MMKSIEELLAEIDAKYNKNPKGWNISVGGPDPRGHGNIFISNNVNLWQLKIDSLFKPNPYGIGTKLGEIDEFPEFKNPSSPSFGFRPLLPSHLDKLKLNLQQKKPINKVINEILNTNPVSINQMTKSNYIMGPIMHSSFKGYVSDKQKELDKKMRRNLDDLLLSKGIGYDYI